MAQDLTAIILDLIVGDIAPRLFSELAFPAASDYAVIAAGTYHVRLTESAGGQELLVWPEFTFDRDGVMSLYVIGAAWDVTLTILAAMTQASRLPALATPGASPVA